MTAAAPLAETLRLGPFIGGLNLRDAYTEIAPNELADGTNLTLDERGVAIKRNDCPTTTALAGASTPPGAVLAFYYSPVLNLYLLQVGVTLYKAAPGAGSWTSITGALPSAVAPLAFCDFAGKVVMTQLDVGGGGNTYTYDGTTLTSVSTVAVGTVIAVWQNKCFIGASTSTSQRTRVWWSAAGNPASWTTATDFVDVREKDDKPITALYPSSGLLVFKEDSTYRINNSTDGSYQTIDWNAGCVGALAVCGSDEGIFHWGLDGLYRSNGIGAAVNIGDKFKPRYSAAAVNATTKPMIAGVALNGRIYFAFPRTSTTITDAILEYNPRTGWLMEAYINARVGPFAKYINAAGAVAASFASASATIKDLYTGTTRTGFTCSLATGYLEPFGGKLARILRLRPELNPPAAASLVCGLNYTDAAGAPQSFSPTLTMTSAGVQRPNTWPGSVGRAFQVVINDTAAALASLSVLQASIDAVQLER